MIICTTVEHGVASPIPKIKDIPVIVVSAKADVTDKVGLLIGGASDYITKPFDIKELLARISELFVIFFFIRTVIWVHLSHFRLLLQ